jgi:sigma-E factor negative regulatory protein RseA
MKQTVSELMDGELEQSAAARVISAIETDPSLMRDWNDYHLIGDAMRAGAKMNIDVRAGVHARLDIEPTVLAPLRWHQRVGLCKAGAMAVAASVSFAAVLAWHQASVGSRTVMVAAHPVRPVSRPVQSDPDAYFLAHQELTADQGLVKVTYSQGVRH